MRIHQGLALIVYIFRSATGLVLPVLFWFLPLSAAAQVNQQPSSPIKLPVLGTEQGLSSNFCYALAQDRKGFLWIATHDGLNRYDGYGFRVYRHNPSDPLSLPGNTITAIQADNRNRIWVIADGTLAVFDPEKERFATMHYPGLSMGVQQICITADQQLLVAGRTAALIDLNTLKPVALGEQSLLPATEQPCAGKLHYGMSAGGQLIAVQTCGRQLHWFSFNPSARRFRLVRSFTIAQPEPSVTPVVSATTDRHGRLHLVFSGYQPLVLDERDRMIRPEPSSWTAVHVLEGQDGAMFYSTESGLFVRQAKDLQQQDRLSMVIPSEVIRQGFQDQTGILWFAGSKGIFQVDPRQRHIRRFDSQGGDRRSLVDDFVFGLLRKPDGRICVEYFGHSDYTLINPSAGIATHIPLGNRAGHDWVEHALLATGVNLPGKQAITDLVRELQYMQIPPQMLWGVMPDTGSDAWVGVNNSLRHTGSGIPLTLPEIPIDVKTDGTRLWMAFPGQGLWCFDPRSRLLSRVLAGKMATGDITSILPGDSGVLWVGTKGAGIYRFVPRTGTYVQYTTDQGLAHNSVYCMTRDHRGRLWIGTANGLSCLHPARGSFQNFFKGHGFANAEYNRHSAITLEDGRVAVGGMSGIDLFHPDSLTYDRKETVLQLTDVKVKNVSRGVYPVYRLKHDEQMVSVHFAVMDFRHPENNQFKYQLSNEDTAWIMLGNRNSITFDYLKPGEHTIRIRGASSDGVWSTDDLMLRLDVQAAWYQRWWFYLLVSASAGGLGYLLFAYRLRQKLQVYRVRQRIHRDLHDDVGATLSSVKAYAEILAQHPDNPVIPSLIAENASEMIERLEVISWAADPRHDHMASLRNRMIKHATPVCRVNGIEYLFKMDGISEELEVPGEIRQHLFMIFKEAIHNMEKYADAHRCLTTLTIADKIFDMRVLDDGRGFDGHVRGTGQGWKNMEARTREMGGTLQIRTAPGQGTEVIVQLRFPFNIPNSWGRDVI